MPHHARDERHAFAQTLRQAGPSAPTLSGAWRTADLAAHVVLRESTLLEPAGRFLPGPFEKRADAALERLATGPYAALVDRLDAGPSARSATGWFWALPAVREAANLLEYVIHHEDVRRAGEVWAPRQLPREVEAAVWSRARFTARLALHKAPDGTRLVSPGFGSIGAADARVTVTGAPVELALFASGRAEHAVLEWAGSSADVAAVRGADLSF